MARVSDISNAWGGPVVLASDETWQARSGWVLVSTEANPDDDGAILLRAGAGDSYDFISGASVRYKAIDGQGIPHLVRMAR
ncbi:MAG: hypothetical protein AB3N12_01405 [Ruegeria sp.]